MNRPTLVLTVGVPGSGKTTYSKKYVSEHKNTIHLSSDLIREKLYGNEAIQGDPNEVFSIMQKMAIEALNCGRNVVYDATNVTRKDRAYIISQCPKFVKIEVHIVWAPIETCIERDATRSRTVGKDVIDRMLKRFQPPYYDEGIDEIKVILPDNFASWEYSNRIREATNIPHDNPHHTLGIKEHCEAAAKYVWKHFNANPDLFSAALYHDVGKPYVKAFVDGKGNPCETAHYYQHHCVSSWMYYGVCSTAYEVAWLIGVHMEPYFDSKYYRNLSPYLKEMVDKLHAADVAAH